MDEDQNTRNERRIKLIMRNYSLSSLYKLSRFDINSEDEVSLHDNDYEGPGEEIVA